MEDETHSVNGPHAAIYLRTASSPDPGDSPALIDLQRDACLKRARELGMTIAAEFADYGIGANRLDRPGLRQLLAHAKTGTIDTCIVVRTDTVARRADLYLQIKRELAADGVQIVTTFDQGISHLQTDLTTKFIHLDRQDARRRPRRREDPANPEAFDHRHNRREQ